jgi:predicted O-methyltransferase YrrM
VPVVSIAEDLQDLPQGWFHHGPQVLALIEQHRPKVVVELGSWLGASAIAMARAVRRWNGTVTCIDTWTGHLNDEGGTADPSQAPLMILSCARAMVEAGVSANIRLIPAATVDVARSWQQPIDFLFIDADHSQNGCAADLEMWFPHVRAGGVIAGDDYNHPNYPGVSRAWDAFELRHGLRLTRGEPLESGIRLIYGVVEH